MLGRRRQDVIEEEVAEVADLPDGACEPASG